MIAGSFQHKNLSKILSTLSQPPKKFLCASAVGFYGNRGTEVLDEKSTKGDDYLASICSEWEDSTVLASDSGINVIHMRTGIVGISFWWCLKLKLLLPANLGGGGPVGGGKQMQSWISLDDEIYAIPPFDEWRIARVKECITPQTPNPVSQKQFAKTLGKVLQAVQHLCLFQGS